MLLRTVGQSTAASSSTAWGQEVISCCPTTWEHQALLWLQTLGVERNWKHLLEGFAGAMQQKNSALEGDKFIRFSSWAELQMNPKKPHLDSLPGCYGNVLVDDGAVRCEVLRVEILLFFSCAQFVRLHSQRNSEVMFLLYRLLPWCQLSNIQQSYQPIFSTSKFWYSQPFQRPK